MCFHSVRLSVDSPISLSFSFADGSAPTPSAYPLIFRSRFPSLAGCVTIPSAYQLILRSRFPSLAGSVSIPSAILCCFAAARRYFLDLRDGPGFFHRPLLYCPSFLLFQDPSPVSRPPRWPWLLPPSVIVRSFFPSVSRPVARFSTSAGPWLNPRPVFVCFFICLSQSGFCECRRWPPVSPSFLNFPFFFFYSNSYASLVVC